MNRSRRRPNPRAQSPPPTTRPPQSKEKRGHRRWKGGRSVYTTGKTSGGGGGIKEARARGRAVVGGKGTRRSQCGDYDRRERETTVKKNRTGLVIKETGNGSGAVRSASELPAYVGTSGGRDFRSEPGLPAVGTSDAGKQKNTLTCTRSAMWGKNMMDTHFLTGD